jgi:hypothetical protein
MQRNYVLTSVGAIAAVLGLIGCGDDAGTDIGVSNGRLSDVTWTSATGVSVVDNSMSKTAGNGWSAGAVSTETIAGSGYVEFTTAETNTAKMAGLSNGDTDQSYQDIDFAVYMSNAGTVTVYEGGAWKGSFGSYLAGDIFRITAVDGQVRYYQNGLLLYTSMGTAQSPLLVDTSLFSTGATVNNVVVENSMWENTVGVIATASSLTKTAISPGWNAGISQWRTVQSTNGYVEFTTDEADSAKMAGLSEVDASEGYQTIQFGAYLRNTGDIAVYENGINRGTFDTYLAGDVIRVESVNNTVRYLKNGTPFYTSMTTPASTLRFDTSFYTPGATLTGITVGEISSWTNLVGVTETTVAGITKSGGPGWNAGAVSQDSFTGDGYCEFTTSEDDTSKMAGLSSGNTDQSYGDIDYAIYLTNVGTFSVYESGQYRGNFGSYVAGDIFRVESVAGGVSYLKNGTPFYASMTLPSASLLVDTSLYSPGATINDLSVTALAPGFWSSGVGVSISTNDLIKMGTRLGWNAGAASSSTESGDVYVQFGTNEANTHKMAGLSNGNTDANYTDIDFGLYLTATGSISIYESGAPRGTVGTYVAGDVFRVESVSGTVTYYQNGSPIYVSTTPSSSPLLLDTSMFTPGATLTNPEIGALP